MTFCHTNGRLQILHRFTKRAQKRSHQTIGLSCYLEHIVLHYLDETLDTILYNRQHDCKSGLGCETRFCATYHDIAKAVDRGSVVHGVILDFKKAFEKVLHYLLMQKNLENRGYKP